MRRSGGRGHSVKALCLARKLPDIPPCPPAVLSICTAGFFAKGFAQCGSPARSPALESAQDSWQFWRRRPQLRNSEVQPIAQGIGPPHNRSSAMSAPATPGARLKRTRTTNSVPNLKTFFGAFALHPDQLMRVCRNRDRACEANCLMRTIF